MEEKPHKLLVIESSISLSNRMNALLSANGYQVSSFKISADAIEELKTSETDPYALIISSYMMPKMKGDQILKTAKEIAPDTQRLLIADTSELQTLISAINQAGIHSCLTLPFKDEDFIFRVKQCCDHYEGIIKQKNLKRLTHHQNTQLFQIASNFKRKKSLYASQIEKKKKEIRILESRIRSAGASVPQDRPVRLKDLLTRRNFFFSSDRFGSEFLKIRDQIKQIMETAVSGHQITLTKVSYLEAFAKTLSENKDRALAEEILSMAFMLIEKDEIPGEDSSQESKDLVPDEHFELKLSENKTQAAIRLKKGDGNGLSLAHVKRFLEKHNIIHGVKEPHLIESWLHKTSPEDDFFEIAQGKEPQYPRDAKIQYHFPTEFLHAGKVNKDGSINFQDRGEIPYVEKNAFLAGKILPEPGAPGVDIHGQQILVRDPVDYTFSSGPGTRMSEDGTRIFAIIEGQPHLDAMGNISVCPEFQTKGDLGFETGDVKFDGNVIVNGTVKQGFKVKCASLTAREIQGAEIDITGDLNVSMGIVNTEIIKVKGSVQAKFVHNSKINAFGDLIVQKEIIDSRIYLSGACMNETGSILNSEISAKMGIRAGSIGSKSSKPSTLTVGVDEHTTLLLAKIDSKLSLNNAEVNELETRLKELENEYQNLHLVISKHAYTQDRAQLELKEIEKKMGDLKSSGDMAALQKVSEAIKGIQRKARKAEEDLNNGFDRQDKITLEISQKKGKIKTLEELNKSLLDEKKRLREFSRRKTAHPEVTVAKKIESGTRIFAANSSLILHNASSRCRIREFSDSPGDTGKSVSFEMRIGRY